MKIIKLDYTSVYLLFILFLCGYIRIGLIISLIILVHELGHVLVCLFFKYKVKSVTLYPFGGITKVEKDINTETNKEIVLALAGIFMQILLIPIVKFINIHDYDIFLKYNLSIMFFNLLPIIPLDGSIVLKSILNKFFSFKTSYKHSLLIKKFIKPGPATSTLEMILLLKFIFIVFAISLGDFFNSLAKANAILVE